MSERKFQNHTQSMLFIVPFGFAILQLYPKKKKLASHTNTAGEEMKRVAALSGDFESVTCSIF